MDLELMKPSTAEADQRHHSAARRGRRADMRAVARCADRRRRLFGHHGRHAGRGPRRARRRAAARAAHRPAIAGRPWRRADPADQADASRYRDHGDLHPRRRGKRDLGDHRRRHRLSAQGRVPDRHRRDGARARRRPFADLGLDRPLHRAPHAGRAEEPGRAAIQHRQADAARDRHIVGHRQRLQLCRDCRAISVFRA